MRVARNNLHIGDIARKVNKRSYSMTKFHAESSSNQFTKSLQYSRLPYESVEINVDNLRIEDSAEFGVRLWVTITDLRKTNDIKCIYLKISLNYSHLISIARLLI